MNIIEVRKGQPFMTKRQISEQTGVSVKTVSRKVEGMREEIRKGRYERYVIAGKLINFYAYIDYLTYEYALKDARMKDDTIPPFEPHEIEKISGFGARIIDIER